MLFLKFLQNILKRMQNMKKFDLSLYFITDPLLPKIPFFELVEKAIQGGVTIVQLREKQSSTKEFIKKGELLKKICAKYKVPLIINDRVDIALAVNADGVHLGQNDMPLRIARKILGNEKIIGVSVNNEREIKLAEEYRADYIAFSPIFPTPTKTDTPPALGLNGVKELKELTPIPCVAIGGINYENVCDVMRTGVDGAAVVSAIAGSPLPFDAAKRLKKAIKSVKVRSSMY